MTVPSFPLLPAPPAGLECGAVTGTVTVEEAAFASPIFLWWLVSFSPSPHRSRSSLPPASDVIVSSFPFLTSRVGAEVPGVSPSLCRSAGRFPKHDFVAPRTLRAPPAQGSGSGDPNDDTLVPSPLLASLFPAGDPGLAMSAAAWSER